MAARVYRGPQDRNPKTLSNRTVNGALLPCTAVVVSATQFSQATAVSGGRLALLADRDYYGVNHFNANDPLKTAYTSGDTGVAYILEPSQEYQWAMAAGTYTNGQELTLGAGGRLTAAASGNIVVAYYDGPGATKAAGDLADVITAIFYTKA
ncbi:hypothetical protein [Roseateles sp.]|uniref:hypothetical protein n=1 Tax=Roseateles sp. TaxID=1971397 RepID=UPI0031DF17FD